MSVESPILEIRASGKSVKMESPVRRGQDRDALADAKEFSMQDQTSETAAVPCKPPPCRGCRPCVSCNPCLPPPPRPPCR